MQAPSLLSATVSYYTGHLNGVLVWGPGWGEPDTPGVRMRSPGVAGGSPWPFSRRPHRNRRLLPPEVAGRSPLPEG